VGSEDQESKEEEGGLYGGCDGVVYSRRIELLREGKTKIGPYGPRVIECVCWNGLERWGLGGEEGGAMVVEGVKILNQKERKRMVAVEMKLWSQGVWGLLAIGQKSQGGGILKGGVREESWKNVAFEEGLWDRKREKAKKKEQQKNN